MSTPGITTARLEDDWLQGILQDHKALSREAKRKKEAPPPKPTFSESDMKGKLFSSHYDEVPKGSTVSKGLNIEGVCRNKVCALFQKSVWNPLHLGQFELSAETWHVVARCRSCQQSTEAGQLGLFNCEVELQGIFQKSSNIDRSFTAHPDELTILSNPLEWSHLKLNVTENHRKGEPYNDFLRARRDERG